MDSDGPRAETAPRNPSPCETTEDAIASGTDGTEAGVAELADARDSKSRTASSQPLAPQGPYETTPECLGAALGAFAAKIAPVAPDLANVLPAWPDLPEAVKAGIVAMVKAARPIALIDGEDEK